MREKSASSGTPKVFTRSGHPLYRTMSTRRWLMVRQGETFMGTTPHVAIVGAGFGGLGVAEQLDHVPVEVTLIDQHNYHTFQPLLYQVATSLLNAEDVGAPVRSLFRHQDNVTFRMATVTGIDVTGHKIQLNDGNQISYDSLVLAGGATVNYFNTPGAAEHAFPLYALIHAVKLRNRILERFEAAASD